MRAAIHLQRDGVLRADVGLAHRVDAIRRKRPVHDLRAGTAHGQARLVERGHQRVRAVQHPGRMRLARHANQPGIRRLAVGRDLDAGGDRFAADDALELALRGGDRLAQRQAPVDVYLAQIGDDIWHDATDNMFTLRRKGITIPAIDVLIGTAAITYDLYLIHSDKHYQSMAEILPLKEW